MLEHAAKLLAAHAGRVDLVQRDLAAADWAADLPAPYDAVVSSLAIHNLADPALITGVYREVRRLLRPGACFLDLDVVFPVGPGLLAVTDRIQAVGRGLDPDQAPSPAGGGGDDQWGSWDDPERRCSLANQLAWLRAAGFVQADCLWRSGHVALLCALAA
jgi:hypothetical protein